MKRNLEPDERGRGGAVSSLARARRGLRQAVGVVLSDSLEALNEHIASQWLVTPREGAEAAQSHAHRLRDVLAIDRAQAVEPALAPTVASASVPPEGEPDPELVREEIVESEELAPSSQETERASDPASALARGPDPSAVRAVPSPLTASEKRERKRAPRREPIRTRTMAQVLVSQGEHERALTIYEELVVKDGGRDPTLVAELEALRSRVGERPQLASPEGV